MKIHVGLFIIALLFMSTSANAQDWENRKQYAEKNRLLGPPTSGENRVVFMGNSITEGWKTTDSAFFTGKPYINRGISGQTTPQMLLRFRDDVVALQPRVVVILAGINDIAGNTGPVTLDYILGNIVSMVELARANHIQVVLCSVLPAYDFPWRPGQEPAGKVRRLNEMLHGYAVRNRIVYADYYNAMADERGGLPKKFSTDGVHPTWAGYQVMEPIVEQAIAKASRKK
jgi:lysophospholipase L1-like esterase